MWIIPTMSRPKQCAEVLSRINNVGCSTKGTVFVNGLEYVEDYKRLLVLPNKWRVIYHPENVGCLAALNHIFELEKDAAFFGFLSDDEILLEDSPPDWDKRLIEAAGNWNAAHGWETVNDGKRLQGYVVLGGDLVRAVGYLAVKECRHNFGFDSMWEWLLGARHFGGGGAGKITLVPEVRVEHRHASWRTAPDDDCYKLGYSTFEEDRKRFVDWQRGDMPLAAERIRHARSIAEAAAS